MPPFEIAIAAFVALMVLLIVALRVKHSHDQKIRRAASSGFYDFDLAHYGTPSAGNSLMEKAVESASRPLAPTFSSSGGAGKGKGKGKGTGAGHIAKTPIPILVRSHGSFIDRSPAGLRSGDGGTTPACWRDPPGSSHPVGSEHPRPVGDGRW